MFRFIDWFRARDRSSLRPDQRRTVTVTLSGAAVSCLISVFSSRLISIPFVAMTAAITFAFISDRVSRFNFENKTEEELSKAIMHPFDLNFVGDSEEGVKWFLKNYRGASRVKNTVFNRTDQMTVPRVRDLNSQIIATMKKVIDAGCSCTDVYLSHEGHSIEKLQNSLKKNAKGQYEAYQVATDMPLIQVLLIEYDGTNVCALIGWGFVGSSKSKVFITRDRSIFEYFEDYFDRMVKTVAPNRPSPRLSLGVDPQGKSGPI